MRHCTHRGGELPGPRVHEVLALLSLLLAVPACRGRQQQPRQAPPSAAPVTPAFGTRQEYPEGQLSVEELQRMLDPYRLKHLKQARVISDLALSPGMTAADVGCGSGAWTFLLRDAVQPGGKVLAVDFDLYAVNFIRQRARALGGQGITFIHSRAEDTRLARGAVDLALLSDVHFFKLPGETAESRIGHDFPLFYGSILRALRDRGRLAVIEVRKDSPGGRGLDAAGIADQLRQVGFEQTASHDYLPGHYFLIFEKSSPP